MTSSNLRTITHFLTPRLNSCTNGITFSTNLAPRGTVTSGSFHPWDSKGAPNVPHWLPVLILAFKNTISPNFSNTFTPLKLLKNAQHFIRSKKAHQDVENFQLGHPFCFNFADVKIDTLIVNFSSWGGLPLRFIYIYKS